MKPEILVPILAGLSIISMMASITLAYLMGLVGTIPAGAMAGLSVMTAAAAGYHFPKEP